MAILAETYANAYIFHVDETKNVDPRNKCILSDSLLANIWLLLVGSILLGNTGRTYIGR